MAIKIARIKTTDGRIARIQVDIPETSEKGIISKGWEALKKPEEMSRSGLKQIAGMIPEPDFEKESAFDPFTRSIPKVAAETLAEVAPSFVSPESIIMGAAGAGAKAVSPIVKGVGRAVGQGLERTSGLWKKTPGVLSQTTKEPSLLLGKGVESAREMYAGEKSVRPELSETLLNNRSFIRRAMSILQKGEQLNPDEALEARKSVDAIGETLPDVVRKTTRKVFDLIAKEKYAEADKAYSRAVKSDAIRSFFGINMTGSPSIVKGGVALTYPITAPLLSPIAQGVGAAGIGIARKAISPILKTYPKAIRTGIGIGAYRTPYQQ